MNWPRIIEKSLRSQPYRKKRHEPATLNTQNSNGDSTFLLFSLFSHCTKMRIEKQAWAMKPMENIIACDTEFMDFSTLTLTLTLTLSQRYR